MKELVWLTFVEDISGSPPPEDAPVLLPRPGDGADVGELRPRHPELVHEHVEGVDPHDGRGGHLPPRGVHSPGGPVLR